MKRHEAAIALAKLNMISHHVVKGVELKCPLDIEQALEDDCDYKKISDELIEYLQEDPDPILYNQVLRYIDTTKCREFASSHEDNELCNQILQLCEAVDKLKELARRLQAGDKKHSYLVDYFADPETEELFRRAARVGLLDSEYKPSKIVRRFQLKLIALAIIKIRGYKTRNKWCHFEEQWGIKAKLILRCDIPLTKVKEVYAVTRLYPEVNLYADLHPDSPAKVFKTPLCQREAEKLCRLLKKKRLLDKNVDEESFLAIQGLLRIPPQAVNWIGTGYALVYFIKTLFSDLNPKVWKLAVTWFTLHGTPINYGTIKTKSHDLNVDPKKHDKNNSMDLIDSLIANAKEQEHN